MFYTEIIAEKCNFSTPTTNSNYQIQIRGLPKLVLLTEKLIKLYRKASTQFTQKGRNKNPLVPMFIKANLKQPKLTNYMNTLKLFLFRVYFNSDVLFLF